jgi:hypothetical protein
MNEARKLTATRHFEDRRKGNCEVQRAGDKEAEEERRRRLRRKRKKERKKERKEGRKKERRKTDRKKERKLNSNVTHHIYYVKTSRKLHISEGSSNTLKRRHILAL